MKHFFLLTLLICLFSQLSFSQIQNGGFEDWSMDTLYQTIPPFNAGSYFTSYFVSGTPNIIQTDGCTGKGIRIETIATDEDTVNGVVYVGDRNIPFENSGISFNEIPDSLRICLRYGIMPGDTGAIILALKSGGQFTNIFSFPLHESKSQFSDTTFALDNIFVVPDSLLMIVSSSSLDRLGTPGSWIELDNIHFVGTATQFPNDDLESTEVLDYEKADQWSSFDRILAAIGSEKTLEKTDDAFAGNYAVKIKTVEIAFGDTLGLFTNADLNIDSLGGGQPYLGPFNPVNLGGFYKYEPVGNDTGVVMVLFSLYNGFIGQKETLGLFTAPLVPTNEWDYFQVPIFLNNPIIPPDTVLILFFASDADHVVSNAEVGIGSTLYIDELGFDQVDGIGELKNPSFNIFPNPSSGQFDIQWDSHYSNPKTVLINDLSGKNLWEKSLTINEISHQHFQIDAGNLPPGMYLIRLIDSDSRLLSTQKIIIKN